MKVALLSLAIAASIVSFALQNPPKDSPKPDAAPAQITVVKAADVKWVDNPNVAGAKMAVLSGDPTKGACCVMMKFPKGSNIAPHWHNASETTTVVSGSGVFGTGEKVDEAQGTPISSGSYMVIPSKAPHWVIAKEDMIVSISMDKAVDFNLCGEKKP